MLISDIVLCNDFDMFATFTFKSDRSDVEKSKSKMSKWLENQQTKYGKFQYLIVPEFHKKHGAIHFHALLKNYKGQLSDSGKMQKGRKVYNIKSYKAGFSTVVKIDNIDKVSSYVKKYITKDMPMFHGRKRFWCSQKLRRPIHTKNTTIDKSFAVVYSTDTYTIYEKQILIQSELPILTEAYQCQNAHQTLIPTHSSTMQLQEYIFGQPRRKAATNTPV